MIQCESYRIYFRFLESVQMTRMIQHKMRVSGNFMKFEKFPEKLDENFLTFKAL